MSRALVPALLALLLLTGACGGDDATPADPPARSEPRAARPSGEPAPSPSERSPESQPTATAKASPTARAERKGDRKLAPTLPLARAAGPRRHLLTAASLPHLARTEWTVRTTASEDSRLVGACQKTALVDIGALDAVRRVFTGPDDSGIRARQVVGRFADAKSAWRAHEVLRAWRDDCEERLDFPTEDVGPMEDVDLASGSGGHYRATYGPKKDKTAAGLGILRKGRWLSVVELLSSDDDYPTKWHPSRRAVRRIAATFA